MSRIVTVTPEVAKGRNNELQLGTVHCCCVVHAGSHVRHSEHETSLEIVTFSYLAEVMKAGPPTLTAHSSGPSVPRLLRKYRETHCFSKNFQFGHPLIFKNAVFSFFTFKNDKFMLKISKNTHFFHFSKYDNFFMFFQN